MPFTVQQLIEDHAEPICVAPNDPVQKALELMIEHDFSQLPVVDKDNKPLGIITSDSILRALNNFGLTTDALRVSNAVVRVARLRAEDDLFEMLDDLRDTYAALIVDGKERLIGIVTSYDTTEYFRRRAEDIMLVEDIESNLKDHILAAFMDQAGDVDNQALSKAIKEIARSKRPNLSLSDLTLGEYIHLFLHDRHWSRYSAEFDLPQEAIRRLLDSVRQTRNLLAHFRGEVSAAQRAQLRFCADWLARHQALLTRDEGQHLQEFAAVTQQEEPAGEQVLPTAEELGPRDSRYAPLALWLQDQRVSQDRVTLTFNQVEEIIGGALPASARQHRAWWANDSVGHVHSQQWLEVGWRVSNINMTEERVVFAPIKERERAYIDFFGTLDSELQKAADFRIWPPAPDGRNWISVTGFPATQSQLLLVYSFTRGHRFRVEMYIDTGDQSRNKKIFDRLHAQENEIESAVGEDLSWERLDERRASRIALYKQGAITDEPEQLAQLRTWAVDAMIRFYNAIAQPASDALKAV